MIRDAAFQRDVEAQTTWLRQQGRRVELRRLRSAVREKLQELARHPALGHDDQDDGTRELSLHPLPFVIWYRLEEGPPMTVRVVRLFHDHRDRGTERGPE